MGNCRYCGKPAGLMKGYHSHCKQAADEKERQKLALVNEGQRQMTTLIADTFTQNRPLDQLQEQLRSIAETHFIDSSSIRDSLITGWETELERSLDIGPLTSQQEMRLKHIREQLQFAQDDLDRNGSYTRFIQAIVLREIAEGKLPQRIRVDGQLPFNLQKSEQLVWLFQNVAYYEHKIRREYVGRSQGVSIRIVQGVYYRTSSFRGHPVDHLENVHQDDGTVAITTKHIYFSGSKKSFRIPYNKIVSFRHYSDGIEIHRDSVTAKPQILRTGSGWFTYNLVCNLAQGLPLEPPKVQDDSSLAETSSNSQQTSTSTVHSAPGHQQESNMISTVMVTPIQEYFNRHVSPCNLCSTKSQLNPYMKFQKLPPFVGQSSRRVLLIGHSPKVRKSRTQPEIKITLDLDNNQGQLKQYIVKEVLSPLGIDLDWCIATNIVKCNTTQMPEDIKIDGLPFMSAAFEVCKFHLVEEIRLLQPCLIISLSEHVSNLLQKAFVKGDDPKPMKDIFATFRFISVSDMEIAWIPVVHIPKAKVRAYYFPEQTSRLTAMQEKVQQLLNKT